MRRLILLGLLLISGSLFAQMSTTEKSKATIGLGFSKTYIKRGLLNYRDKLSAPKLAIDKDLRKQRRKEQRNADITISGIGFELSKPKIGPASVFNKTWKGVNILYTFLEFGVSHGEINFDPGYGYGSYYADKTYYGRRYYLGFNIPISGLGIGTYKNYNRVFRIHPTLQIAFGSYAIWKRANKRDKTTSPYFAMSPGVRLRLPYCSFDVRLNASVHALSNGDLEDYFKIFSTYPSFVLRFDGLYQFFNPKGVSVNATSYQIKDISSQTQSHTTYRGNQKVTVETTTSSMTVSSQAKKVVLDDIGPYFGIGPRYTFSLPYIREYSNTGGMFGVGMHGRASSFLFGLNMEGGRIGHASTFKRDADKNKFKLIDKTQDYGRGSLKTFNMFFDVGIDLTAGAMAMLGTVVEENKATGFFSLNGGYSFGFSIISGQRFDNDSTALLEYSQLKDPDKRTDPRESKSGYLGGFFLGVDVGAVNFRIQAYRFRGAPLASQTFYSVTYRLPLAASNR